MNPRLWTIAGAATAAGWGVFAFVLMPWLIGSGFEGAGPLAAVMGDRETNGLAFYQDAWSQIARKATVFGLVMGGVLLTLVRRGELERHFFAPLSPRTLAIVRITLVAVQLMLLLPPPSYGCWGCDPSASARLAGLDAGFYRALPSLDLLLAPIGSPRPDAQLLQGVWLASLAGGLLALIGLWTRVGLLTLAWGSTVLVTHAYSFREYHHPESLFLLSLWILALAPSGRALSLDAILQRVRASARSGRFDPDARAPATGMARWPITLIMWLVAISYLDAGLSKAATGGLAWVDGHTLAHYFARDGLARGHELGVFLAQHPAWLSPMAAGALVFELSFFVAVLYPRVAPLYVAAGLAMHTSIFVVHGPLFLQTMALYIVFLEPLRDAAQRFFATATEKVTLVYDGQCALCIRTMAILDELAPEGRLATVDLEREVLAQAEVDPEKLRHAMHAVATDGRVSAGFEAFATVAHALPVLWPTRPLFWIGRKTGLGPRIYEAIASRRHQLGCRSATCTL